MRYHVVRRGGSGSFGTQVAQISVEGSGTEWATFGMPFEVGDVPAGHELAVQTLAGADVPSQGPVQATWDDGTCCHAVISAQLTGGQSYKIVTSAPSGPDLTVADLLAAIPGDIARVNATSGITATMTLRDLLENATNRARLNNTSSYVIVQQGPRMLDLWVAQNLDTHVRVEMQFRWYGGTLIWCDPIVYNGYVNLNGMASRTFTFEFLLNGVQKELRTALAHPNRAMKHGATGYWSSGGTLYVRHVASELMDSGAVPKYATDTPPTDAFLNSQITSVAPYANGDLDDNLGGTGAHTWLGIVERWWACYLTSNCKRRAWQWGMANSDACMAYQFSSLLDSATGEMLSISDRPTFTAQSPGSLGSGYATGLSPFGNASTGQPASHAMAAGFMAYLTTGQLAHLKSMHGWGCFETFWTASNRNHTYNGATIRKFYYGSIRGAGWNYRTMGQCARFTPDWHYLKSYFVNTVNGNLLRDYSDYGPSYSSIGVVEGSEPITEYRTFMHYHLTSSVCYLVCDLRFELGRPWAEHLSILVAGLMGNTGEYNWCFATAQDRAVAATDAGPYYTTFAQLHADTRNVPSYAQAMTPGSQALADAMEANGDITDNIAGTMTGHATSSTGYPSNIRPCVAYLEALGVTGAAQCWANLNQGLQPDYSEMPQFDIEPR